MKKLLTIITKVDQPEFIENLVERLAGNHVDMGYGSVKQTGEWQPVETSTTEIYMGGTVELMMEDEQLNIPYISNFLFTCLKSNESNYRIEWCSSLS